jgi:hypothetical protein
LKPSLTTWWVAALALMGGVTLRLLSFHQAEQRRCVRSVYLVQFVYKQDLRLALCHSCFYLAKYKLASNLAQN